MPRNTLSDLNNHLFMQMERLNDDNQSLEQIETELKRTKAMTDVSRQILEIGRLSFNVAKFDAEYGIERNGPSIPEMLTMKERR